METETVLLIFRLEHEISGLALQLFVVEPIKTAKTSKTAKICACSEDFLKR